MRLEFILIAGTLTPSRTKCAVLVIKYDVFVFLNVLLFLFVRCFFGFLFSFVVCLFIFIKLISERNIYFRSNFSCLHS